jgi:hypothetical protein
MIYKMNIGCFYSERFPAVAGWPDHIAMNQLTRSRIIEEGFGE